MKLPRLLPFLATTCLVLTLLVPWLVRAQETPPAPPPPPSDSKPADSPPDQPAPVTPDEPVAPAEPAPSAELSPAPGEPRGGELRRLDVDTPAAVEAQVEAEEPPAPAPSKRERSRREIVVFGEDALLSAGEAASKIVAISGNVIADGDVDGEVVAIMGDVTVNGHVDNQVVAVLGNVTINGTVDGQVVAVMGGVQLGPKAVVNGEIVTVGGGLEKAPGAVAKRGVQQIPFLGKKLPRMDWLRAWVGDCLMWGRPLWFGEHLGWVWGLALSFFAFYVFLALVFGRAVTKCAETLEQRPGGTILTSFLAALLTPVLMIVLAVTGVGPILLLFAVFIGMLFGKAALLVWLGRRYGLRVPVLAALAGGITLLAFYLIPLLGLLLWKFTGLLGFGMVVHTLILSARSSRPAAPVAPVGSGVPPPVTPPPAASFAEAPTPASVLPAGAAGVPPSVMPHPPGPVGAVPAQAISAASFERAGFWLRLGAAALDVVLIGIVFNFMEGFLRHLYLLDSFPLWLGIYCVAMWATKGTTIGGIVCGLKVVRLDDRPMDWPTAIVRGLGAFLSLAIAGLGFIWVAFDNEKQSWHDKIAGTTIVRVPKGVSLV